MSEGELRFLERHLEVTIVFGPLLRFSISSFLPFGGPGGGRFASAVAREAMSNMEQFPHKGPIFHAYPSQEVLDALAGRCNGRSLRRPLYIERLADWLCKPLFPSHIHVPWDGPRRPRAQKLLRVQFVFESASEPPLTLVSACRQANDCGPVRPAVLGGPGRHDA